MNMNRITNVSAVFLMALASTLFAQTMPAQSSVQWTAAKRQLLAVTYNENKQTTVTMAGTAIAPRIKGKADVEYKQGRTNIRLEMDSLANPQSLGGFFTTYILWAVAPEGQAENLMELPIQKNFKIESTTKFQTFGLIITAEPHSRVELPSSMIVAENSLRAGTQGRITTSKIEYSGDPGIFYPIFTPGSPTLAADYNTPLMILGARRAVEIAVRADARKFADPELRDSEMKLASLEQAWPRSRKASDLRDNAKKNSGLAHDVMRVAEQARKLSVERYAQARLTAERQQSGDNLAQAKSETDRAQISADRATAEARLSKTAADLSRGEADRATTDAAGARTEARRAGQSERDQAARGVINAALAREKIAQAQSETEKAKTNEGLARDDADKARQQAEEAKRERDASQQRLYISLSAILETRREARGLIVNLSDVLFDTGQSTLKPGAREKLSKLAGILLAYPEAYRMDIEGHTDSVGTDEANLKLSQGRAESVRTYLLQNGVKPEMMMAAHGFGESKPVAENDTAAGRQVNRRVEIIIADQLQAQGK